MALARQGRLAEAEAAWVRAASLMPGDAAALVNLGLLYEQAGDAPRARDAYEQALTRNASSEEAAAGLARLGS